MKTVTNSSHGVPLTDGALMQAMANGDADAFRSLYERHATFLSIRLWRRCRDPQIAEDVLQDTFLAAWRGAASYEVRGEVAAWLWGIAVRTLAKRFRSEKHTPVALGTELTSFFTWEEEVVGQLDVIDAMDKLSPDLHDTFQAVAVDGLSTEEASALLGVPPGTIKSRMHRARLNLREELQ
jgi:RNA polymerase sigma-70 factor (ECF subfamily)